MKPDGCGGHPFWAAPSEGAPLNQGIPAAAVVSATKACGLKAEAAVKGHRRPVGLVHLKRCPKAPPLPGLAQQRPQQGQGQAAATPVGMHRHRGDMKIIDDRLAAGQAQQLLAMAQAVHEARRMGEFAFPLLQAPEATEGQLIESPAVVRVPWAEPDWLQAHRFRVHGGLGGLSYIVATVMIAFRRWQGWVESVQPCQPMA